MPSLPVERVARAPHADLRVTNWPGSLACVQQVLQAGLDLGPLTVLVGENGSGKSTLVEAIAQAYGLSAEGGSTGARHSSRATESPLWQALHLSRGIGAARWGFFLRAETMHGFYSYLEANPGTPHNRAHGDPVFHEMSHGESFLEILARRFTDPGLYVLDEPESALSFTGCLSLIRLLHGIANHGTMQAIVATHSPLIAAVPGARILEVGEWGLREKPWDELELVEYWRGFLADPDRYLRHVID
jgi:predicted ATPase